MALATSLQEKERRDYNFITVFTNAPNVNVETQSIENHNIGEASDRLLTRLNKTQVLSVIASKVVPAGALFVSNKYIVRVKLLPEFSKSFVLFRGLLEFSRPKSVTIVSYSKDEIFEIEILETQIEYILSYIETMVGWLIREIRFKEALGAIIRFEKRVKQEQASLYSKMQAAVL